MTAGVEFARLTEVDPGRVAALMAEPSVRRHLPLSGPTFDVAGFVAAKERLWAENGWGPWAFLADGEPVGWGGPQPEGDDVDIALVLGRSAWGLGAEIHHEVLRRVFLDPAVESVTALLPPSRGAAHALRRRGCAPDGEVVVEGHAFRRYRLCASRFPGRASGGAE